MDRIIPAMLRKGDTIAFAATCHIAKHEKYDPIFTQVREFGYKVYTGEHFFADGWGFSATPEERAADIMQLVNNDEVRMIWFGGGEGADEVIPLLDYDEIRSHPKIWMGFSDGTSVLNAVHARTGLTVWYGMSPGDVIDITGYNRVHLEGHIFRRDLKEHVRSGEWHTLVSGKATGRLLGGYLENFSWLANAGWMAEEPVDRILVLEEHRKFFDVPHVSDELGRLQQAPVFRHVKGILIGEYSDEPDERYLYRLRILGERYGIPVAYCTDFGHGANSAIFPFGFDAELDTAAQTLVYKGYAD